MLVELYMYPGDPNPNDVILRTPVLAEGGGGPMNKVEMVWEEMEDRFRLHAFFCMGPWLLDPQTIRFTLWAPNGEGREFFWPMGGFITREGIGDFAVDLFPTQVGTWYGRWDAWGQVGSSKDFAFSVQLKGDRIHWEQERSKPGVLPKVPLVVM